MEDSMDPREANQGRRPRGTPPAELAGLWPKEESRPGKRGRRRGRRKPWRKTFAFAVCAVAWGLAALWLLGILAGMAYSDAGDTDVVSEEVEEPKEPPARRSGESELQYQERLAQWRLRQTMLGLLACVGLTPFVPIILLAWLTPRLVRLDQQRWR